VLVRPGIRHYTRGIVHIIGKRMTMGKKYTVKSGDTLSKIAKEMLGDADRWPEILEANKDVIKNPNVIQPGLELDIPAEPAAKKPSTARHDYE
jgi:LysM repeat protein